MYRRNIVALALAALALALALAPSATAAPSSRAQLAGSVPRWATATRLKRAAAPGGIVGFRVYLNWRHNAAAEALAQAVSDSASPGYQHYLTPAQFRQRFAPTTDAASAVESWLTGAGFTVGYVPDNRHFVSAKGTVAQIEAAFRTRLNEYRVNGVTLRAPESALTIPSPMSARVAGVIGIDQSASLMHPLSSPDRTGAGSPPPPAPGFRNAPPYSRYWGEKIARDQPQAYGGSVPYAVKGYTPAQLRGAYGISGAIAAGNDGTGVTVAVIEPSRRPLSCRTSTAIRQTTVCPGSRAGTSGRSWRPAPTTRPRPTRRIRKAGGARRRSTSRPCTPWLPERTSCTSGPAMTATRCWTRP